MTLLLNALASPVNLGLYKDDVLLKIYESDEKASEFLPKILDEILREFTLSRLIYANGPGSYMGIKISFLALKTLSIVKEIPLFAVSAFELNGFKPIRANNNFCFILQNGEISLQKAEAGKFTLPKSLKKLNLSENNEPFYFLDAVWGEPWKCVSQPLRRI